MRLQKYMNENEEYTIKKGTGSLWIVYRPDGQSVKSVGTKAMAMKLAKKYNEEGEDGISGSISKRRK
jgi:hypothetical protein